MTSPAASPSPYAPPAPPLSPCSYTHYIDAH